jgi:hypothetical protein
VVEFVSYYIYVRENKSTRIFRLMDSLHTHIVIAARAIIEAAVGVRAIRARGRHVGRPLQKS